MKTEEQIKWNTADEIDFLKHLGTGKWNKDKKKKDQDGLKMSYLGAMGKRKRWGHLDPEKIRKYLVVNGG